MKVYRCPKELPAPEFDYSAGWDAHQAKEEAHCEALKAWLKRAGYTGPRTGEIARFPVADGYAQYMLAEGSKSCLIHLPYMDAYQFPYVERLTKADIVKNIDGQKKIAALFAKKAV